MKTLLDELLAELNTLGPAEKDAVAADAIAATADLPWVPNPGPQTEAYYSEADELLYGGEAGGGKSDLLLGLALNEHQNSRILRRINQDVAELGDRLVGIVGSNTGYRAHPPTWRGRRRDGKGQQIDLRGCEFEKDKQRYKGRPRDFIGYDELADFLESQYVFINTWNRSTDEQQRCRIVGATNGPTTIDGQWILRRWGAWLDPKHPKYPTPSGVLRWYLQVDGQEVEVDGPGPHEVPGRGAIRARSRSFIRSRLADNPDLSRTDYAAQLESLPEELRRVYRDGDFTVGLKDGDFQVIPSAWIEAAMQRWTAQPPRRLAMTTMAVDVAPGGGDKRVISHRYGGWYGPLDAEREEDKTGRKTAAAVVFLRRDNCPVIVDLGGGWGGDATIALKDNGIEVVAFNGVVPSSARTRDGKLGFKNKRAEATWKFREALDPSQEGGSVIALPPDPELKADLASYQWTIVRLQGGAGIQITEKAEQKELLGRSPDKGDAVIMCLSEGDRAVERAVRAGRLGGASLPSTASRGYSQLKR